MPTKDLNYYYNKFKYGEDIYHFLMSHRVKEILLVSPFYDAFVFEQDGRLSEQIFGEYRQLNLSTEPIITTVPTAEAALELVDQHDFDLVITMLHTGSISPFEMAKRIKSRKPNLTVLLLLSMLSDIRIAEIQDQRLEYIDNIFLWKGDTKLFFAMVKHVEDQRNLAYDTKKGLVRVILLVEDSIQFYSVFLPLLYEEILKQTQILIKEEISDTYKRLRMRARPKVILARNYEEAHRIYQDYREYISAVISDMRFPREGHSDPSAGLQLIRQIKADEYDVPTILMSSDPSNKRKAESIESTFLNKQSRHLLTHLRRFIIENMGFGDFVFRNESGREIGRAHSLLEFEQKLQDIPTESLVYHSKKNHFSTWLMARGEIQIAKTIRPMRLQDFPSTEDLRSLLLTALDKIRSGRNRGKIVDFRPDCIQEQNQITRLAEGSLGGKGRGLAFLNALLVAMDFEERYPEIRINLPQTAIIGTNEYDRFLEINQIDQNELETVSDARIDQIFLRGSLSSDLLHRLEIFLDYVHYPIAIRSSGLLEDSLAQPLAGIYRTYMLPNNQDKRFRLKELTDAIKLVFASVFLHSARSYIENLQHKVEEEKMAVIIQQIVGSEFDGAYFYPHISGIAQSYNFYPIADLHHEDGIASVALGLGKTVIEGGKTFRFCPQYPKIQFLQPKTLLIDSQKEFFALKMSADHFDLSEGEDITLERLPIGYAVPHGSLEYIASIWDPHEGRLIPGLGKKGQLLISFDHIVKYNYFPLADVIRDLLEIGQAAFGLPVEIEFAVNLHNQPEDEHPPSFDILQIRPLGLSEHDIEFSWKEIPTEQLFLYTEDGMGNGQIDGLRDIVFIEPRKFDKMQTVEMRQEIGVINQEMRHKNREYILIAPGRWGSQDRFLGIPVKFAEISQARVIVEIGLKDFNIDPSQGTHFFHNMIAMKIGYFNIPYFSKNDFLNWDWLLAQTVQRQGDYFTHVRLQQPVEVRMDGKTGRALICKPQSSKSKQK